MRLSSLPRYTRIHEISVIAGVIPARLASTRLSRKVLRELAGRPMVEWVWRAAMASGRMDPVVVATDSDEVAAVCRQRGIPVVMTSASLRQRIGPGAGSGADPSTRISTSISRAMSRRSLATSFRLCSRFLTGPRCRWQRLAVPCPEADIENPNAVKVVTALGWPSALFLAGDDSVRSRCHRIRRVPQAPGHLCLSQGGAGAVCVAASGPAGTTRTPGTTAPARKRDRYLRRRCPRGHHRRGHRRGPGAGGRSVERNAGQDED